MTFSLTAGGAPPDRESEEALLADLTKLFKTHHKKAQISLVKWNGSNTGEKLLLEI